MFLPFGSLLVIADVSWLMPTRLWTQPGKNDKLPSSQNLPSCRSTVGNITRLRKIQPLCWEVWGQEKNLKQNKTHKITTKPDMLSVDLGSLLALGLGMLELQVSSILTLSIDRRNHYRIKIRLFQKATSLLRPIPAFLNLHLAGFVSRPFHTKHNNKSNLIRIEP